MAGSGKVKPLSPTAPARREEQPHRQEPPAAPPPPPPPAPTPPDADADHRIDDYA